MYGLNVERVFQDGKYSNVYLLHPSWYRYYYSSVTLMIILNITVCQKIIQCISAKHYRCNGQPTADNEIKYPVPMIAKNVQLLAKDMEATNSSKVNVSRYLAYL